jgi:hypothetical protein
LSALPRTTVGACRGSVGTFEGVSGAQTTGVDRTLVGSSWAIHWKYFTKYTTALLNRKKILSVKILIILMLNTSTKYETMNKLVFFPNGIVV